MSEQRRRRWQIVVTGTLMLLVDLAVLAPRLVFPNATAGGAVERPATRPRLPGIAYELGLVFCVLVLTANTRWSRLVRVVATVVFAAYLFFSIYHEAYMRFVFNGPAVVDDWRLLINLMHFLRIASVGWTVAVVGWALAYVLIVGLAAWTFRRVQEQARALSWRWRAAVALGFTIVGGAMVTWVKHPPANAFVQPLGDSVVANLKASRTALASLRVVAEPPDTRYDHFATTPLGHRPNVYLLTVEAYGELLARCPSKPAYRDLLGRIEARLDRAGFHARSGYSAAPIYGARSWLSMATMQTGIHIDAQPAFRVLENNAARVPTLTSFFQAHGYHTMMLQPLDGPRVGVASDDIYRRDRTVIRKDLPYRGAPQGLAGVPDQYSLGYFDEHELRSAPQPRFVFYMGVSTHYNWWTPPPYVADWHRLDGQLKPADAVSWPTLDGQGQIADPMLADYLATIEYEWRVLADFIEARRDEDALLIVIGDHQPTRIECADVPVNFDTPIHVISRDRLLVDSFAEVGLTAGLFAEPGRSPPLRHEGLFSLLVAKLTAQTGPAPVEYLPTGIPLNGLHR